MALQKLSGTKTRFIIARALCGVPEVHREPGFGVIQRSWSADCRSDLQACWERRYRALFFPVVSPILAALLARVIDVRLRQVLYLLFGDVEMDTGGKSGHIVGGDSHFLVTPQMPLFEKYVHVGHLMCAGVDAERT